MQSVDGRYRGVVDADELGLRERKKRALRARLSDTATAMFLASGFANVRVEDIATACGVTPKTLYSYFPTKESLLFERGTALAAVLDAPHDDVHGLFTAVLTSIRDEIRGLSSRVTDDLSQVSEDPVRAVRAFVALVGSAPSLRAAAADEMEVLTQRAAAVLSEVDGYPPESPENQVAASALISLWRIHLSGLLHHPDTADTLHDLQNVLLTDIDRSAELLRPIFCGITAGGTKAR